MTREDLINQRATTCRHGGHCEWVACDKCNHYEPTSETITNSTSGYLEVVLSECDDCISRQAVLNTLDKMDKALDTDRTVESYKKLLTECYKDLPSVTPKEKTGHRKLTNHEWIDFLSEQFDISRTSAKEMLHAMMSVKKEDNFKKQFSQGKKGFSQGFSQGRK